LHEQQQNDTNGISQGLVRLQDEQNKLMATCRRFQERMENDLLADRLKFQLKMQEEQNSLVANVPSTKHLQKVLQLNS
jgi:hypothetical protein